VAVVRSLTKLWSIPGIRAGYVLAEPSVIGELQAQQSPWSVSAPAAAAMIACSDERAQQEAEARIATVAQNRNTLVEGLRELGFPTASEPQAPFVLVQLGLEAHSRLRAAGYALRRADTFPGLNAEWVRIAVRGPELSSKLLSTIQAELLGTEL